MKLLVFKPTTYLKQMSLVLRLFCGGGIFHLVPLARLKWAGLPSVVARHLTGAWPWFWFLVWNVRSLPPFCVNSSWHGAVFHRLRIYKTDITFLSLKLSQEFAGITWSFLPHWMTFLRHYGSNGEQEHGDLTPGRKMLEGFCGLFLLVIFLKGNIKIESLILLKNFLKMNFQQNQV